MGPPKVDVERVQSSVAEEKAKTDLENRPLARTRILLAEDAPEVQRLMGHLLRKAGAELAVVENGQLAVDTALAAAERCEPFDVVLMDMEMPVLDGFGATALLRAKGYKRPIIALTGHSTNGDREKCIEAGCDEFATKPVGRAQLFAAIQALVAKALVTATA